MIEITDGTGDVPATVADSISEFVFQYQGRRIGLCSEAPAQTRVRVSYRVESQREGGWLPLIDDLPLASGRSEFCFHAPRRDLSGAVRLRFDATAPGGAATTFYSPDTLTALIGEGRCNAQGAICCDFASGAPQAGGESAQHSDRRHRRCGFQRRLAAHRDERLLGVRAASLGRTAIAAGRTVASPGGALWLAQARSRQACTETSLTRAHTARSGTHARASSCGRMVDCSSGHSSGSDRARPMTAPAPPKASQALPPAAGPAAGNDKPSERTSLDERLRMGELRVLKLIATGAPLLAVLEALVLVAEEQSDGMLGSVLFIEDGRVRHASAPRLRPRSAKPSMASRSGPPVARAGPPRTRARP